MYRVLKPLLFTVDPETIHRGIHHLGKFSDASGLSQILKLAFSYQKTNLEQNILGLHFKNPIGLAAGFDKNGEIIEFMSALGFGFVEIGSITAKPWSGNPRPRLFRLPKESALLNRMGLNNHGAEKIFQKLRSQNHTVPLGINVTKTPDPAIMGEAGVADFCESFQKLYPLADYLTLNISCPNTAEGKTFEDPKTLAQLLPQILEIKSGKAVLIKISPDLEFGMLDQILEIAEQFEISGYVIGNTSARRDLPYIGSGGISGRPLAARSLEQVRYVRKKLPNTVIIGCGGIFNARDAQERLDAGANLLQIYTGLIYEGPSLVKNICRGLTTSGK